MSTAGSTAPIAVTSAGVGVDSMMEEKKKGIVPVSQNDSKISLQIARETIFPITF